MSPKNQRINKFINVKELKYSNKVTKQTKANNIIHYVH